VHTSRRPVRLAVAAVSIGIGLLVPHGPGRADEIGVDSKPPSSARQTLARAYHNLYAEDYVQVMRLVTAQRGGQEMSRSLQITRRQSVRPGKALLRFTKPQQIRRTSVLVIENEGGSDELFVYLPAMKRTKRLSASQRADAFFGTDLSYEDVEPKHIEDYEVESLGSASHRGLSCRVIEQRAKPPYTSDYEKMVSCIEPERGVILYTDFYKDGEVIKRLEVDPDQVRVVGERFIPFLISVETPSRSSATRVVTERYELRSDIPDELFSTWNLEAGDAKRDRRRAGEKGEVSLAPPGQ
jgi:hypothetical protein